MNSMKSVFFVLIASVLCCQSIATAETPSSVIYLMNEPVTLFDYGMDRIGEALDNKTVIFHTLNEKTKKYELESFAMDTSVHYSWSENKIIVVASPNYFIHDADRSTAEQWCAHMINKIRAELGVDQNNPGSGMYARLEIFFSHYGYSMNAAPQDLGRKLAGIIDMRTYVDYRDKEKDIRKKLICTAALSGSDMHCSEYLRLPYFFETLDYRDSMVQ